MFVPMNVSKQTCKRGELCSFIPANVDSRGFGVYGFGREQVRDRRCIERISAPLHASNNLITD